jgi:hypothetical protein
MTQNKLEAKWERRLKKYGLGVAQPMTDHSEGEMADVPLGVNHPRGLSEKHMRLRATIDSSDRFMDAHQITKVRSMDREIPEWALSNKEVQRILLLAFPTLKTNPRQRARASMYNRIIYLYWRMRLPYTIVAREMGMSEVLLKRKIQTLTRLAKGLDNHGVPRKRHPSNKPVEGTTEGSNETIKSPLLHRAGDGSNGEDGTPPQKNVQMPKSS